MIIVFFIQKSRLNATLPSTPVWPSRSSGYTASDGVLADQFEMQTAPEREQTLNMRIYLARLDLANVQMIESIIGGDRVNSQNGNSQNHHNEIEVGGDEEMADE